MTILYKMKTTITALILLALVSCQNEPKVIPENILPKYHVQKDTDIKDIIINDPLSVKHENIGHIERFILQYPTIRIKVYHQFNKPFETPEEWSYYITRKDGSYIYMDSYSDENKIAPETIQMIKTIALESDTNTLK